VTDAKTNAGFVCLKTLLGGSDIYLLKQFALQIYKPLKNIAALL